MKEGPVSTTQEGVASLARRLRQISGVQYGGWWDLICEDCKGYIGPKGRAHGCSGHVKGEGVQPAAGAEAAIAKLKIIEVD